MNFNGWIIVACEISFWMVILLGLTARYLFNLKKVGFIFLALTPIIDLLLIIITSWDLYRGATATFAHGLAAVYIGVSISFGKNMIEWMDERFKYFVLKSTSNKPSKRTGIQFAKHYAKGLVRHILAYLIGSAILLIMIYFINEPSRTEALNGILKGWALVIAIDILITISYFIWPKKEKKQFDVDNKNM
ncbi:hypothetical protein [Peribacillus alkalitolerans]|uniref:hypothetical protein n=1 Tax=Peribacillus alkalitolerans TaxID=1550385 RepID=UPI0013D52967|nr:hypothetical protein [Peribacillus alkalitolerans]